MKMQEKDSAKNQERTSENVQPDLRPRSDSKLPPFPSEEERRESYNPFEHRNVPKPTTDCGALAHLLKTSLGSGILAMPMAISNAGLVLGVFGTVTIGLVCTHCLQLLVRSSQVTCKKARIPQLGYAETAEVAFRMASEKAKKWAKFMKIIITIQLLLSFILGNTVYVVFMAETMKQVIDFYFCLGISVRYYMLGLWIPLILICLFRTLKSLVPFSATANIFVVVSFGITLYYIFREIHEPQSVNMVSPIQKWPFFLTTVVFSLEGIGTVMSIENEMKNPSHLIDKHNKCCGILYISMSLVIAMYTIIGFFGYLQYGENTEGSITLNLPIKEVLAQAVKVLIALAIFFTYALQFYVPINIVKTLVIEAVKKKNKFKEKYYNYIDIAVRVFLVSMTIVTAMVIPKLEPVITLVGAICFSMLGLTFPPLLDIIIRQPDYGRYKWRLCKNIFIILFSVLVLVSGTYAGINAVIDVYILHG